MATKRLKHNKKRNTAFLYESLVKQLTKAVVEKNESQREAMIFIIKEAFRKGTFLQTELQCYKNLLGSHNLSSHAAEKLIFLTKQLHSNIDRRALFNEQTQLINAVNKKIGKGIFANFVPNYKDLATIYQIFNQETSLKTRVLLEEAMATRLMKDKSVADSGLLKPVDSLIYNTFVKKFNERYNGALLAEQQKLLNTYILSFADNGIDLKVFLNEEVARLKEVLTAAVYTEEIVSDESMIEKTREVIGILEGFGREKISSKMIKKVLKTQQLVSEIQSHG